MLGDRALLVRQWPKRSGAKLLAKLAQESSDASPGLDLIGGLPVDPGRA